ncbi:MAG: hypothetical protein GY926_08730, partial [bacterium]|nr:hypothetical protein [bacterium]
MLVKVLLGPLAILLLVGCGGSRPVVETEAAPVEVTAQAGGKAASVVEFARVDLEAEVEALGSCAIYDDDQFYDPAPVEGSLQNSVLKHEWSLAVGPFDIEDPSDGSRARYYDGTVVVIPIVADGLQGAGLWDTVERVEEANRREFSIPNIVARYWPDDGVVLIVHIEGKIRVALALYENGVAAIGACHRRVVDVWNPGVAEAGFERPLDAVDLLLRDPS